MLRAKHLTINVSPSVRWDYTPSSVLLASLTTIVLLFCSQSIRAEISKQLIVKFKETATQQSGASTADMALGLTLKTSIPLARVRSLSGGEQVLNVNPDTTRSDLEALVRELEQDDLVEYVELDLIMWPQFVPNDPLYSDQWHYYEAVGGINLPQAWDLTLATGVVVGILDTGYRPHEDIVDNILPGYDFVSTSFFGNDGDGRDGDPTDPGDAMNAGECGNGIPEESTNSSWHGTHVTGTVAAVFDNNVGVSGVAPNAKVLPLRVLGKCGGFTSDIADAIRWAVGMPIAGVPNNINPVKVINLSLSSSEPAACSNTYRDAIEDARAAGAVVIVAAGNNEANADSYSPGNCTGVITVAATNRIGEKAVYSNFGNAVDIAAPGGEQDFSSDSNGILSLANDGSDQPGVDNYVYYQGTSMATPHVTGTVALLFGINNELTPDEVETTLKETARPFPGTCEGCGFGVVDAAQASLLVNGDILAQDQANLAVELVGNDGKFKRESLFSSEGRVYYIAKVTNLGPQVAINVAVDLVYPAGDIVNVIESQQGVCNEEGSICDLGTMEVGESIDIAIDVVTTSRRKSYSALVFSDVQDFDQTNDQSTKIFGGAMFWLLSLLGLIGFRRAN
ncbi:MAG: S8 family serine peptidase [Pseudomonadales bacterium]|nr:S8 family serine peptidase [Pseudomonadales bacterium]